MPSRPARTLRHSFATRLLGDGYDVRIVDEPLGYRDVSTTMTYTHVFNRSAGVHAESHARIGIILVSLCRWMATQNWLGSSWKEKNAGEPSKLGGPSHTDEYTG